MTAELLETSASPVEPVFDKATVQAISQAIQDATFEVLVAKPRRVGSFLVTLPTNDGTRQVKVTYQALSGADYDALMAAHAPTPKQQAQGMVYNPDTFAPALISAVSLRPKMSAVQAKELYSNPDWSPGESGQLFMEAIQVCQRGLDVPFSAGD